MDKAVRNIQAGQALQVRKLDGSQESVQVRILRIKDFPRLLAVVDHEPASAEVYCDRPGGWAETLADESIVEIVEVGEKLNDDFFVPWAKRRLARMRKIAPDLAPAPSLPDGLINGQPSALRDAACPGGPPSSTPSDSSN